MGIGPSKVPNGGEGLFAIEDVKSGSYLAPYESELISESEFESKYGDRMVDTAIRLELSRDGKEYVYYAGSRVLKRYH